MNTEQLNHIQNDKGFIAALDQSGGSTPAALAAYGVNDDAYQSEDEMYETVHAMRTRIITSPAFSDKHILGAILFKRTMRSQIDDQATADYLWQKKRVVPFLKIDNGLAEFADGVQLMKLIPEFDDLLQEARQKNIFGTKMRSVIKEYNEAGIVQVVDQQFEYAKQIIDAGLMPIIEPEVDIHAADRTKIETRLRELLTERLDTLADDTLVMLKLTIPEEDDWYASLIAHPRVARVVALSGGFSKAEANEKLARNHGLIASFSRALAEGLSAQQSDEEFTRTLQDSIDSIYRASAT